MIVYNDTKKQFVDDVKNSAIADKILTCIRKKGINAGGDKEYTSWENSMQFMRNIVDDQDIEDEVRIAIEYNIPLTSKRVDFIIYGSNADNHENVVIVELKQWQEAEIVDDEMHYCVRTNVGKANNIVCHPSYQAYSYARFLYNYCQSIADNSINIVPCAYLHNFKPEKRFVLDAPIYKEWTDEAPFFIKSQVTEFNSFVKKFVTKRSSRGDVLYLIDNGRIRPTKALQDTLVSMVKGNKEFILLDEQAVIYDMCLKTMSKCIVDGKKRTLVIQGGPGTGKSVLAVNLLMEFISQQLNTSYVTKNSAPRNAFLTLLTHSDVKKKVDIKQLFRSPFNLASCPQNAYDCLIVDEAHRLVKKMYGDWSGENQVKESINASLFTIFMLDEDQAVTTSDIGSVAEIEQWCKELNSRIILNESTRLVSQFRCNGSGTYIQFIDQLLQRNEESVAIDFSELNYDFRVFDNPNEMRDELRKKNEINNKSRMVAGYCYDWNVKKGRGDFDIILPYGFKAKWNLASDNIWAVNPNSFEEVGCIHTAQGLEFDYVGVIIGRDLLFDKSTNEVLVNQNAISKDDKSSGIRSLKDKKEARRLILNTYKTLLTRGQKGCYVYCEDKALADYIRQMLGEESMPAKTVEMNTGMLKVAEEKSPIQTIIIDDYDFQKKPEKMGFIPLYSVKAACGYFEEGNIPEVEGWLDASGYGFRPDPERHFAVYAKGDSMLPKIHNGDLCVFEWYKAGSRNGEIVLTQCQDNDPEYGGRYTIKKYSSEKDITDEGWLHSRVELKPLNNDYQVIELDAEREYKTVGILKCVILNQR
jgi:hypothetical protein